MDLSIFTNIFRTKNYLIDTGNIRNMMRHILLKKIDELGLSEFLDEDSNGEKQKRMKNLTFISLTPRQYHKKVMLFTLPQFLISLYSSLYSCSGRLEQIISWEYLYHSHHIYMVLISSILYWGNYDSDNEKVRKILRRFDMMCVMFGSLSLFWRAWMYSRGLTKATGFAYTVFMCLFFLSHYCNKVYPYKSIWSHSLAHTMVHIYNVHYFMTIYRIKTWRLAKKSLLSSS